jgi:glutathione peroxidase
MDLLVNKEFIMKNLIVFLTGFKSIVTLIVGCFLSMMTMTVLANEQIVDVNHQMSCPTYLQQDMRKLHSDETINICKLAQGKTVLMVNTASNCGFTKQFKALETLHQQYKDDGLVIIGFPSDDFFQEENDEKNTADVCYVKYGVTFTMLATTAVRGDDANPIFKHLAAQTTSPKWNFYKYLITNNGDNIKHFNSRVAPNDKVLTDAITAALSPSTVSL